jgi:hypothetical protein
MYNVDRCSQEFIEGVHDLLDVAKANTQNGFMCCPCVLCKNVKDYASSRTLHEHLFRSGFMPNHIFWTMHRESGVIIEEDEEEEGDDDNIIRGFAEYGAFDDTAMGEAEEEVAAMRLLMNLVRPFMMYRETAKVKRRRSSSSSC